MSSLVAYIRTSTDAEKFYSGVSDLLFAAFPGRLESTYLLSSRADGTAIATSDVDFAVVFKGTIERPERATIKGVLDAIQRISPVMLDILVTSEAEVNRGITPTLQHYRLLAGPDVLKDRPLRPKSELMLYYAGLVVHFIQAIRNEYRKLRYPLSYPNGETVGFCGYEKYGTRTADGAYAPGLNMLATLVLAIGSYRLAVLANVYTPSKSALIKNYEAYLPNDPWLPMMLELRLIVRTKLAGRVPSSGPEQERLFHWCPQVLTLENEFLDDVIMRMKDWLPIEDPGYRRQLVEFVSALETTSPVHAAKLTETRALLGLGAATP